MTVRSGQSVLDVYLAGLAQRLRGPRRLRADLIAEARGSLIDATEAWQRRGLADEPAARRAVAEFGSYAEVVPDYQTELAVAQGRRTALLIGIGLGALYVATTLIWWHGPWTGQVRGDAGYSWLADAFDYLSVAGAAAALLVRLGLGWGSRYMSDGLGLTRLLGRAGLGFLALHGFAGAAVYLWSLTQWPGFLHSPPIWGGVAVANVAFGYAAVCAWRCVAVSRGPDVALPA